RGFGKSAERDGVHHARQDSSRVFDGLTAPELRGVTGERYGVPAELRDRHVQRQSRSRRCLFENQSHRFARQQLSVTHSAPFELEVCSSIERVQQSISPEARQIDEVIHGCVPKAWSTIATASSM